MKHKNFKILGLPCTKTDGIYYIYTPLSRLRATSYFALLKAAIKYRLGFKKWYK